MYAINFFKQIRGKTDKVFGEVIQKLYIIMLKRVNGLKMGKTIKLYGYPLIDIRNGGKVTIGDNVTLTSKNKGYHLHIYKPVKLFVDRKKASIVIGNNTRIHGACIHACKSIRIGENCLISGNVQIMDSNGHSNSYEDSSKRLKTFGSARDVKIMNNVWIGANSIILPGVTIGEGSIIGAGSVVTKDIPAKVVAAGNPAKVVRFF